MNKISLRLGRPILKQTKDGGHASTHTVKLTDTADPLNDLGKVLTGVVFTFSSTLVFPGQTLAGASNPNL